jgi:hypothetical protein
VRPAAMLPAGAQPEQAARAFTGVYEFTGLTPDTFYTITAEAGPDRATLNTRTLPAAVPAELDRWFNVLLVSCFHQAEAQGPGRHYCLATQSGGQAPSDPAHG